MRETLLSFLPVVGTLLALAANIATSAHAIMYRRDARAVIGWAGLIWLVPVVGAILYVGLGVNRIRRRALAMGRQRKRQLEALEEQIRTPEDVARAMDAPHLAQLVSYVGRVVEHTLLAGNRVELLVNGEQAFPAMLEAIRGARCSISLATYIFDSDRAGTDFVEALAEAVKRGVQVRVLVDGVGSRRRISSSLSRRGVRNARFLPPTLPWRFHYYNLRSHRKLMVVDGQVGFTGGMNIREGNLLELKPQPRHLIQDIHFRIEGPVVAQFQEGFAEDWMFTTNETLAGEDWYPRIDGAGDVIARAVPDGPDENFEVVRMCILGALSVANHNVRIVTPYFLPDAALIAALGVTAMRGVEVDIVLPAKGNLRLVQWASTAVLWQVLERGCRVWYQPEPFPHTKLMTIDGAWCLIGSSNWDPRSHRLNFEFDVELYDRATAARVESEIDAIIARSTQTSLEEVDGRSIPIRLLHGSARLLSPYL
jgi:cardiolipin synthase